MPAAPITSYTCNLVEVGEGFDMSDLTNTPPILYLKSGNNIEEIPVTYWQYYKNTLYAVSSELTTRYGESNNALMFSSFVNGVPTVVKLADSSGLT
jgi:hypothetical protein